MNTPFTIHSFSFDIALRHTFTIAQSSRTHTPAVLLEVRWKDLVGYGEAALPPYLRETQASVKSFLDRLDLSQFDAPDALDSMLDWVGLQDPTDQNRAARAAIDIALHDLWGKYVGRSVADRLRDQLGAPALPPPTSYTIGIASPEVIRQKVKEADPYKILKVKLGSADDRQIIETIRSVTDKPLFVDANQGWKSVDEAARMIDWLAARNVLLVEQPLPKEDLSSTARLRQIAQLPLIADESFQSVDDLDRVADSFDGVNIKLMKCGGLREAVRIVQAARVRGLRLMLGCMTETSCAISAAAALAGYVDYCDLDGNLLIANDPFDGAIVMNGKVWPSESNGIGVEFSTWRMD